MSAKLSVEIESFPIAGRFTIARGAKTEARVVTAHIEYHGQLGRGECVPYSRYGETVEGVAQTLRGLGAEIQSHSSLISRAEIAERLPAGAARNAIDCALWDLEAKLSGMRVFERAGLLTPKPVTTAYTISLDDAEAMANKAREVASRPLLKIKLGGPGDDMQRIARVREAAPRSVLIADANEGWNESNLEAHLEACRQAGFQLIEQPLPAKDDRILGEIRSPVPLCADESVHDRASLDRLVGLYGFVNIKLDKTGGLTEALEMAKAAETRGFGLMIGCMVGTSLAMAPALLLANRAQFVDLDGPLLLSRDREGGLTFEGSTILPPRADFWG